MLTFAQLKTAVRSRVFPAGEARNLRPAHDKSMVDALVDVQRWVDCLQNNNVQLVPHCATFFNCGLTSFDFRRARIKKLSVVDSAVHAEEVLAASGSSSSSSSSSASAAIVAGTVVATINDSIAIFAAAKTYQTLYQAGAAQSFLISAVAAGQNCGNYGSTKPQYVRTEITYTDPDGTVKKIQVGAICRLSDCNVTGSVTIAVKANTTIFYSLTPFNTPFTDGGVNVTLTITAATSGAIPTEPDTVVDNSTGGVSASTSGGDWCGEVFYRQVEPCEIHRYLARSTSGGFCADISSVLAIPRHLCGNKSSIPVPTDEGVDPSLPPLQLGYHYPQESTDSAYGRAEAGVWSIENGRIYIAPWIESSETVVIRWEGIKRDWVDDDLVDDDPGLLRAIELFLRWEHARDWDENLQKAGTYEIEYRKALADLIYDCEEENRVRSCEPSHARGIAPPDIDTAPPVDDDTGGTGGGGGSSTVYYSVAKSSHASCSSIGGEGAGVTITIPARAYTSTVSQADADAQAQDAADALAEAGLTGKCVFWNTEQTATSDCPDDTTGVSTEATVAAHTYSASSQSAADKLAYDAAKVAAAALLDCVADGDPVPKRYCNTAIAAKQYSAGCTRTPIGGGAISLMTIYATVSCPAGVAYSEGPGASQEQAQYKAQQEMLLTFQNWSMVECQKFQNFQNVDNNAVLTVVSTLPEGFCAEGQVWNIA